MVRLEALLSTEISVGDTVTCEITEGESELPLPPPHDDSRSRHPIKTFIIQIFFILGYFEIEINTCALAG
jgi:hypothetical protein